ncbi:MAG: class I SAM-dependent methyltransferase [Actinomycetota bacterium]|nr:class I SAM-dependent methyltransferase [Actinomycetota bacterium]
MTEAPRACLVCGSTGPFELTYAIGDYRLVRCRACTLLFQDPPPSPAALASAYYEDAAFADALMTDLREITLANARQKVELLRRSGTLPESGSTVLDVGASSGAWLETAAAERLVGTGVELGASTAAAARGRGLDVRTGTLADALPGLGDQRFDLITFWDVLEHLPDPRHELGLARSLLAPGGTIAMTFPNADGLYPRLTHRLFARRTGIWEYPELPVHLYDFSPTTARQLLESSGLDVVGMRTFATPYGFYRSTTLSPDRLGPGWRSRLLRVSFDVTHRVAYPLARLLDRGNSMFVAARIP